MWHVSSRSGEASCELLYSVYLYHQFLDPPLVGAGVRKNTLVNSTPGLGINVQTFSVFMSLNEKPNCELFL